LNKRVPKAIFRPNYCSACFYNHLCDPINEKRGEKNE